MKKIKVFGLVMLLAGLLAIGGIASIWAPDRSAEDLSRRWAQPPSQLSIESSLRDFYADTSRRLTTQRFHSDIAKSRLVMFDKLGHVGHEEDPASTVAAAQDFLEMNAKTQ
jgi:pimeloyl-ACP methyl ester carboxylesterase